MVYVIGMTSSQQAISKDLEESKLYMNFLSARGVCAFFLREETKKHKLISTLKEAAVGEK